MRPTAIAIVFSVTRLRPPWLRPSQIAFINSLIVEDVVEVVEETKQIARPVMRNQLAGLLRDIFGNPFRSVTLDPTWRTSTVVALANSIYEERAFEHMPILADALEDAGCTSADILNHCREPGEHVRGRWVVDLLLGKE